MIFIQAIIIRNAHLIQWEEHKLLTEQVHAGALAFHAHILNIIFLTLFHQNKTNTIESNKLGTHVQQGQN